MAPRRARAEGAYAPERLSASILTRQTLILEDFPSTDISRALSPNGRAHWATKKRARAWAATMVDCAAKEQHLRPVRGPVRLLFRYTFPDRRKRDVDNLTTGVTKAAIDSLVRSKVLAADDSEHVTEVKAVAVVEKGARRLEVTIEPVPAAQHEAAERREEAEPA